MLTGSDPFSCRLITEWATKLTEMGEGKHHIGDFLPPEELERFMETFQVGLT